MEQDFIARTALDEIVESDHNQMLKAMIPYLPPFGQQFLSMYTKTRELKNTMELFKYQRNRGDIQAASISGYTKMLWRRKPQADRSAHKSHSHDTDAKGYE